MKTRHRGSCHCGRVKFEFEAAIDGAVSCNCSICSRKGAILLAAPVDSFRLLTPAGETSSYTFNTHAIAHRFCKTCGIQPFSEHADGRSVYINLRCVEGLDLASVPIMAFDGKSL
jgi:hypothetical protein